MIIFVYVFKCSLWLLAYILLQFTHIHTRTYILRVCVRACVCANANDVVAGVPCDFLVCINTPHNLSDNLWDSDRKAFESNPIEQLVMLFSSSFLSYYTHTLVFFFIHSNFITKWSHHWIFFLLFFFARLRSASRMKKFQHMISIHLIVASIFLVSNVLARQNHQHARKYSSYPDYDNDLSLWINEAQVKRFSGKLTIRLFVTKNNLDEPL